MIRSHLVSFRNSFAADERGNVAMMFGLALVPLLAFSGAAIDYTRYVTERAAIQAALDSTALATANSPSGTPLATLQARASSYFAAAYTASVFTATPTVTVSQNGAIIRLEARSTMEPAFMQIVGVGSLPIVAASQATNEQRKLEIALVLDNTGSMAQSGKMTALKNAVGNMISSLEASAKQPDDVKLAIVPFNTEVKIGTSYSAAGWLRWDVTIENPNYAWWQRLPPTPASWAGCIADRDQPYDLDGTPPSIFTSRYVASQCHYPDLTQMMPLTTDLEAVRTRANAMTPTGNTNVAIGLATGLAALRSDSPLGANAATTGVEKFIVLLTDGDNTANRWTSNQTQIDARLSQACTAARLAGTKVYTIRVIAGNAALLRSCATSPDMYYDVNNAAQLDGVFKNILKSITGVRITS